MTDHTLLVLCIPVALTAGLLWGIAWEKHRASHRRKKELCERLAQRSRIEATARYYAEHQADNAPPLVRHRSF